MSAVRSLLALLALLVGCATQNAEPPASAASSTTSYLVKETNLVNGAVGVRLDIPLEPAGRKPAVIALLGDTHPIVAAGFVAVTYTVRWGLLRAGQPTPSPAEQAVGKWVLASPSADVLGERYLREIATTADTYVPALIDWLVAQPEIDPDRIAMTGSSTNGFVTLQAVAADRRLVAAVAIAACGDYHRFLQFSEMGMAGQPLQLAPAYAAWVRSQEVSRHPERLTHAAVLMMNRASDPLIPISCAEETARALSEAFAAAGVPQRFRFARMEGEGHGMGAPEIDATMAWLREWLAPR
ncbi:MAG: prolyl oligopeptidase family serine peptidase [Candidatus Binatia bacterium]